MSGKAWPTDYGLSIFSPFLFLGGWNFLKIGHNVNMIKFTDGKKEYIWNDNNEIIGMDKNAAEVLKDLVLKKG